MALLPLHRSETRASAADRPPARVVRERLTDGVDPILAPRWLRGEPRAVALSGNWAGGGIVLSSHPALLAAPTDDPFELLDLSPLVIDPGDTEPALAGSDPGSGRGSAGPATTVGGGWIGWL